MSKQRYAIDPITVMRLFGVGFAAAVFAMIMCSQGCATHIGTAKAVDGSESKGVYLSLGNTSGPAGLEGATISIPSTAMAGEIFRTIGNVALALIPGGASVVRVERAPETSPAGASVGRDSGLPPSDDLMLTPARHSVPIEEMWNRGVAPEFDPVPLTLVPRYLGTTVITTEERDWDAEFMRMRERPAE